MQYKKEIVRQRIMEVGKTEYLDNGFRGGNIKTIAEKAGVPVGNLYRYFDGKEGLLDAIVSPVYDEIPNIIERLARLFNSQKMMTFLEIVPVLTDNAMQLLETYKSELLILAYRCEKTKYSDFTDKIVAIISTLIIGYVHNPTEEQKEFVTIISKSFITTLFGLLRDGKSGEELKTLTSKLLVFTFTDIIDRI